jgi:hypothetical protein
MGESPVTRHERPGRSQAPSIPGTDHLRHGGGDIFLGGPWGGRKFNLVGGSAKLGFLWPDRLIFDPTCPFVQVYTGCHAAARGGLKHAW